MDFFIGSTSFYNKSKSNI